MSSQSFADLGVSKPVVAALSARGFQVPFAVQQLVIADVLAGRDVLAQSPTGSGKTLAFGIPLVDRLEPGGGPDFVKSLTRLSLVDEYQLTTVPIAIGAGRSPFAELEEHLKFDVVEEERFQSGALAQILVPKH